MSAKKDILFYVEHILGCIADVERYVGHDRVRFLNDDIIRNATLRQLQIMSESCMRLPQDIRSEIPRIDWAKIAGFRNILVHDYTGDLDFDIVWDVITCSLPDLKIAINEILRKQGK